MLFTFTLYNLPPLPNTDTFVSSEFINRDKNHEKYRKNNQGKTILESFTCNNDDNMGKFKDIDEVELKYLKKESIDNHFPFICIMTSFPAAF